MVDPITPTQQEARGRDQKSSILVETFIQSCIRALEKEKDAKTENRRCVAASHGHFCTELFELCFLVFLLGLFRRFLDWKEASIVRKGHYSIASVIVGDLLSPFAAAGNRLT